VATLVGDEPIGLEHSRLDLDHVNLFDRRRDPFESDSPAETDDDGAGDYGADGSPAEAGAGKA
jgi:hypothetical protein